MESLGNPTARVFLFWKFKKKIRCHAGGETRTVVAWLEEDSSGSQRKGERRFRLQKDPHACHRRPPGIVETSVFVCLTASAAFCKNEVRTACLW